MIVALTIALSCGRGGAREIRHRPAVLGEEGFRHRGTSQQLELVRAVGEDRPRRRGELRLWGRLLAESEVGGTRSLSTNAAMLRARYCMAVPWDGSANLAETYIGR